MLLRAFVKDTQAEAGGETAPMSRRGLDTRSRLQLHMPFPPRKKHNTPSGWKYLLGNLSETAPGEKKEKKGEIIIELANVSR